MIIDRRNFAFGLAGAAALTLTRPAFAQLVDKTADKLRNGEFNWYPERSKAGPLLIIVSIPDQKAHVYRNGIRIAASTCSTGKTGHETPTGVFKILQKDKDHHSSTYNNAPMPNMNRLTWSGVALHAGNLPGYPASHGCVRLPLKFSELLFSVTKLGMTVVIADASSAPGEVVHPGMVLGDYAKREYAAVDAAILQEEYRRGHTAVSVNTSVVVSSRDRTVTVMDDDRIVAQGHYEPHGGSGRLGEHVFTLTGTSQKGSGLRWLGARLGYPDGGGREDQDRSLEGLKILENIKADPKVREQIRIRLKNGMTLVTTDQPSNAQTRTSNDFVVITGLY